MELSSAPIGWSYMKTLGLVGSYLKLGNVRKRACKYHSFLNGKIEKEATV